MKPIEPLYDGLMRPAETGTNKWDYRNLEHVNETIWTYDG